MTELLATNRDLLSRDGKLLWGECGDCLPCPWYPPDDPTICDPPSPHPLLTRFIAEHRLHSKVNTGSSATFNSNSPMGSANLLENFITPGITPFSTWRVNLNFLPLTIRLSWVLDHPIMDGVPGYVQSSTGLQIGGSVPFVPDTATLGNPSFPPHSGKLARSEQTSGLVRVSGGEYFTGQLEVVLDNLVAVPFPGVYEMDYSWQQITPQTAPTPSTFSSGTATLAYDGIPECFLIGLDMRVVQILTGSNSEVKTTVSFTGEAIYPEP